MGNTKGQSQEITCISGPVEAVFKPGPAPVGTRGENCYENPEIKRTVWRVPCGRSYAIQLRNATSPLRILKEEPGGINAPGSLSSLSDFLLIFPIN